MDPAIAISLASVLVAVAAAILAGLTWNEQRHQRKAAEAANLIDRSANRVATDRANEAIRTAEEANRIAHEALEHQRALSEVKLRVDPSIGYPLGRDRDAGDPLNYHIEAVLRNVGSVEARVNHAYIATGVWPISVASVEGDYVDQARWSLFPFTLLPGCECRVRFHGWVRNSFGEQLPAPPDFHGERAAWTTLSHIAVHASHATFRSEDNSILVRLSAAVQKSLDEKDKGTSAVHPPPSAGT